MGFVCSDLSGATCPATRLLRWCDTQNITIILTLLPLLHGTYKAALVLNCINERWKCLTVPIKDEGLNQELSEVVSMLVANKRLLNNFSRFSALFEEQLASCAAGWLGQNVNFALGWLQHLLARGLQQAKTSSCCWVWLWDHWEQLPWCSLSRQRDLRWVGLGLSVKHPSLLYATCIVCMSEGVAVSLLVSPVWRTYSWWQLRFHPGWCSLKSWFVWNKGRSVLYIACSRVACLWAGSVEAEAFLSWIFIFLGIVLLKKIAYLWASVTELSWWEIRYV